MTLNRYVLDTNVLISAVFSPQSPAFLAYQKALDTGILLASQAVLIAFGPAIYSTKCYRMKGGRETYELMEVNCDAEDKISDS